MDAHESVRFMKTSRPAGIPSTLSSGTRIFLFVTVAVSGAAVLVIEILGARLLGPFFGSSLYVWSSIIATTLFALATGYALGGLAADRAGRMDVLYALLLAAAVNLILVPVLRGAVLEAASSLGPRLGALAAAVALLYLPLTLLGAVTPLAYKIATADLASLGRTVGYLSAVSTVGSVAGALLAGFFLLAELGARNVCWLVSACLAIPAILYFVRRRNWAGGAGAGVWAVLWLFAFAVYPRTLYADADIKVIDRSESLYGEMRIVDWRGVRNLMVDGTIQGGILLTTGRNAYPYEDLMSAAMHAWRDRQGSPQLEGILCGLGPAALPNLLSDMAHLEVFELDPRVPEMAVKYFGFDPVRNPVRLGDGRRLARDHAPATADFVAIDAYASEAIPFHLMSTEAIATFKRLLKPNGLMILNTIGLREGPGSEGLKSIYATLGANFAHRVVLTTNPDGNFSNFVLMASDGSFDGVGPRIPEFSRREVYFPPNAGAVLTDDRNQIDLFWTETSRLMRQNLWENVPHGALLD